MLKRLTTSLKKYSFHFLLIPVVFVLHVWNSYFGLLRIHLYFKYIFIYLLLAVALFLLFRWLYKQNRKSAIVASYFLMFFFGFGAFHDTLKTLPLPSFLYSYTFLLPLLFLVLVFIGWSFLKLNTGFEKLNYFLNLLFLILFLLEAVNLSYNLVTQKQKSNFIAKWNNEVSTEHALCDTCAKPDIYFIVWDAYTSSKALKENFNYDNSDLDSFLTKNHFYISYKSKSNYRSTPFSISSTFDMTYLDDRGEIGKTISPKLKLQALYTLEKNKLFPILEKEGYEIKNFSIFDFDSYPAGINTFFDFFRDQFFYNETLFGRIRRDIWWNFIKYLPSKPYEVQKNLFANQVEKNIGRLLNTLHSKKDKPLFVYTHIFLPHEPFYLDEKGNFTADSLLYSLVNMQERYVKQVIFTNTLLKKVTTALMADSTRPKIIIMEGDHGFRNYNRNEEGEKPFQNLNSYYFPDHDYSELYDGISPVNSFRVIFNKYFNQHLPMLKDSSVNLRED